MGFNQFGASLALRLLIIMVALSVIGFLIVTPGYHAATLLALFITAAFTFELFKFITKTNQEVTRFLDAIRYADFGQRFDFGKLGAGFPQLEQAFTHILERFREDRTEHESELRHLKALLEHVPVPLISIHASKQITLWNNSARRLFGISRVTRLPDLEQFGAEFFREISAIRAGGNALVTFQVDNMEQRLTISASEITMASKTERLISLQDIQSELDGMQLSAWQDLVRVLTHEIMNSITPVASLAKTAADLLDDVTLQVADKTEIVDELRDVKDAVSTVARRSDALMNFVSSYRQLTHLPSPQIARVQLSDLFADVTRITTLGWQDKGLALIVDIEPGELDIQADRQMVEQVLINLLQNCAHALNDQAQGQVTLNAKLNKRGHVTIEVSDNGPGVPEEIVGKIFVPFFTTRREGSGVGLALSRQVMIAHGGTILFANNEQGGACLTLVF